MNPKAFGADKGALQITLSAFHLSARDRPNVGNVPSYTGKGLYDRNDHNHQENEVNQRGNDRPEKYQDTTNTGDRSKHRMDDCRDNVKKKPRAPEDDRLHRVKAHKVIVLFQDIKNDAAD